MFDFVNVKGVERLRKEVDGLKRERDELRERVGRHMAQTIKNEAIYQACTKRNSALQLEVNRLRKKITEEHP